MQKAIASGCFLLAVISAAVCAGTATPVAYGLGEATTGVSATWIVSAITTLLGGAGGLWALLRKAAPAVLDVARPFIGGDQRLVNGGVEFVASLFDEKNDISEDMERGAILLICHARSKSLDKAGTDAAFELLQHITEQHAKAIPVQGGKAVAK